MAKTEEAITFSAREMEVLALAWQCFDSEPKIDIKKLARLTGYTEGSASVTIGKIKRKLKTHGGGGDSGATPVATPKKTPVAKTPKSGKRAAAAAIDFDESPTKRKKKQPSVNAQQDRNADDDDEEFKIKPEFEHDDGYGGGYGGYGGYSGYTGYTDFQDGL